MAAHALLNPEPPVRRMAPANDRRLHTIPIPSDCLPQVATLRYVTIKLAALVTGLTEKAIRRKMERGIWLEGKHWRKRDGVIYIDTKAIDKWVETETA